MSTNIKDFVIQSTLDLINHTSSDKKIKKSINTHIKKPHFIPIKYRVFGGLLHSMNIQFGNFIERLLHTIVNNEESLKLVEGISGKRKTSLSITTKSQSLIDEYITKCQSSTDDDKQELEFKNLLIKCLEIEKMDVNKDVNSKYDVDVLFQNAQQQYFYLEVKYNDDHDTGKYDNINGKFIKTYVGICNEIKNYNPNQFKPILYYLTPKRMKGNIYIPERNNIYRGDRLFNEFFSIDYGELVTTLDDIGTDNEIIKLFDDLYQKIMNTNF